MSYTKEGNHIIKGTLSWVWSSVGEGLNKKPNEGRDIFQILSFGIKKGMDQSYILTVLSHKLVFGDPEITVPFAY